MILDLSFLKILIYLFIYLLIILKLKLFLFYILFILFTINNEFLILIAWSFHSMLKDKS